MRSTQAADAPTVRPDENLAYSPRSGPITVRGIRLLVVLTLINTTLLGMSVLGPQLFPFLRQQWQQWQAGRAAERKRQAGLALQRQCLAYAPAADELVYEEDPVAASRLLKEGKGRYTSVEPNGGSAAPFGWVGPVKLEPPPFYPQFTDVVFGTRIADVRAPLLFLHERTTPGGVKRLVAVRLERAGGFTREATHDGRMNFNLRKRRMLVASGYVVTPDSPAAGREDRTHGELELVLDDDGPRTIWRYDPQAPPERSGPIDYGHVLRFFAGQPDPADPSHFTLHYQLDGRPGVIDGWATDPGIKFQPREGQWTTGSGGSSWKLMAPATRPATVPTDTR